MIVIIGLAAAGIAGYVIKRWYLALLAIIVILFLSMAAQAKASVRVSYSTSAVYCHAMSVTEYRDGVLGAQLWGLNERLNWCAQPIYPPEKTVYNVVVHRSYMVGPFWNFGGYITKTRVRHLYYPERWTVYVQAVMLGMTATWANEHNYPSVRITHYKATGKTTYAAHCGCG